MNLGCIIYAGILGPISAQFSDAVISNFSAFYVNNRFENCSISLLSGEPVQTRVWGGGLALSFGCYVHAASFVSSHIQVSTLNLSASGVSLEFMSNTYLACSINATATGGSVAAVMRGAAVAVSFGSFVLGDSAGAVLASQGDTIVSGVSLSMSHNSFAYCSGYLSTTDYGSSGQDAFAAFSVAFGPYLFATSSQSGVVTACVAGATLAAAVAVKVTDCVFQSCVSQTLTGSNGFGSQGASVYGGCLGVHYGGFVSSYGVFINTHAAIGGIKITDSTHVFARNIFSACSATTASGQAQGPAVAYGGALYVAAKSSAYVTTTSPLNTATAGRASSANTSVSVTDSVFSNSACASVANVCLANSTSSYGGALYSSIPQMLNSAFRNCTFSDCSAVVTCSSYDSSSAVMGGALCVLADRDTNSSLLVTNATFTRCKISGSSSTSLLRANGGCLSIISIASAVLDSCSFQNFSISVGNVATGVSGGSAVAMEGVPRGLMVDCGLTSDLTGGNVELGSPALRFAAGNGLNVSIALTITRCKVFTSGTPVEIESSAAASSSTVSISDSTFVTLNPSALLISATNTQFAGTNSLFVCPNGSFVALSQGKSPFVTTANCSSCFLGSFSVTPNVLDIGALSAAHSLSSQTQLCNSTCLFGISQCATTLRVAQGFWAEFTPLQSTAGVDVFLTVALCPPGYCCDEITGCVLYAPVFNGTLQSFQNKFPCSQGRQGILCGACKPGYTQSLASESACISDDVCSENIGWSLAVLIISVLAMAIVVFMSVLNAKSSSGSLSIVVYYLQMSNFAVPTQQSSLASGQTTLFSACKT